MPKVVTELDLNVRMMCVSDLGTCFQGYLPDGTRYTDLVRVFGEPQLGQSSDNKIKAKWIGKINSLLFTIYDYKSNLEPVQNTCWHIGGKHKLVAQLVCACWEEVSARKFHALI